MIYCYNGVILNQHYYYVYSTGTNYKPKQYNSRQEAESSMYKYCNKNGIILECSERDKHERKYTNHKGVRFYINRV